MCYWTSRNPDGTKVGGAISFVEPVIWPAPEGWTKIAEMEWVKHECENPEHEEKK